MQVKNCCEIESVEIAFPSQYVIGVTNDLRHYFRAKNIGKYLKFVQTSTINYGKEFFNDSETIGDTIQNLLTGLKNNHIIQIGLNMNEIRLHKITLQFSLPYQKLIFCDMRGFRKINKNTYASLDYRQNIRPNKKRGSKGKQYSFIHVINHQDKVLLKLCFSRKYIQHITISNLFMDTGNLIQYLLKLGSVYITQATCPEYFRVTEGYFPYFLPEHQSFIDFLHSACWFDSFNRRNITKRFLGGV